MYFVEVSNLGFGWNSLKIEVLKKFSIWIVCLTETKTVGNLQPPSTGTQSIQDFFWCIVNEKGKIKKPCKITHHWYENQITEVISFTLHKQSSLLVLCREIGEYDSLTITGQQNLRIPKRCVQ